MNETLITQILQGVLKVRNLSTWSGKSWSLVRKTSYTFKTMKTNVEKVDKLDSCKVKGERCGVYTDLSLFAIVPGFYLTALIILLHMKNIPN